MGNTLTGGPNAKPQPTDKRFNNSSVAQTVREITMNRHERLAGKLVKINIAKACANQVISKGASERSTVATIQLPFFDPEHESKINEYKESCMKIDPADKLPKDQKEANIKKCLEGVRSYPLRTQYIGLQIDDDREKYCGNEKGDSIGIAGINLSMNRGSENNSRSNTDNFMLNYCAKSLYDRGCIRMGTRVLKRNILVDAKGNEIDTKSLPKDTKQRSVALAGSKPSVRETRISVPELVPAKENPSCYNNGLLDYGTPECSCLNSFAGPNLNTWPSDSPDIDPDFPNSRNPYGLVRPNISSSDSGGNSWTKYSLNIFGQDSQVQYPIQIDKTCHSRQIGDKSTGAGPAYTLAAFKPKEGVQICINQINVINSNIGNLDISDVKQSCGAASKDVEVKGASVGQDDVDPVKLWERNQRETAELERVEKEKIENERREVEKKKIQDQLIATQKALAEVERQKQVEAAARAKAEADARAKADAEAKAKAEAAAKAQADAKAKADADAKAQADALALARTESERNAAIKAAADKAAADKAAADKAAADKAVADKAAADKAAAEANAQAKAKSLEEEAASKARTAAAEAAKIAASKTATEQEKTAAQAAADKAAADRAAAEAARITADKSVSENIKVEANDAAKRAATVAKETALTAAKAAVEATKPKNNQMLYAGIAVVIIIILIAIFFATRGGNDSVQTMQQMPMQQMPMQQMPMQLMPMQ
jgi:hypothetical protein